MALTTTPGATDADSYATLAEFETRATAMGWTLTGDDAAKEVNLRRAAIYLDGAYEWTGIKATDGQALQWPRFLDEEDKESQYFDTATIPPAIKQAQMEVAYIINSGTDPFAIQSVGAVKRKRVKAGPVETETEYTSSAVYARFRAVDFLVKPWVIGGLGGMVRVVRG